jgi:hypothetical protein
MHDVTLQGEYVVAAFLVEGEVVKTCRIVTLIQELYCGILCVERFDCLVLVNVYFGHDTDTQILAHRL